MAKGRRRLTTGGNIKVIAKIPAARTPVSRGFYQVEEDSLYVPLHPAGKFYSFLDSPQVVFDIDAKGRLLFLQVHTPRRNWVIREGIRPPVGLETADIRFLGFRETITEVRPETSTSRSWLRLVFSESRRTLSYNVAENLIFELTRDSELASIWITAIENDRAARTMAAWRKQARMEDRPNRSDSRYIRVEIKCPPR